MKLNSFIYHPKLSWGAQWPGGRALDSESRVPGFNPHWGGRGVCVVSLRKTQSLEYPVLVITHDDNADMTEKLLTGMLSLDINKSVTNSALQQDLGLSNQISPCLFWLLEIDGLLVPSDKAYNLLIY